MCRVRRFLAVVPLLAMLLCVSMQTPLAAMDPTEAGRVPALFDTWCRAKLEGAEITREGTTVTCKFGPVHACEARIEAYDLNKDPERFRAGDAYSPRSGVLARQGDNRQQGDKDATEAWVEWVRGNWKVRLALWEDKPNTGARADELLNRASLLLREFDGQLRTAVQAPTIKADRRQEDPNAPEDFEQLRPYSSRVMILDRTSCDPGSAAAAFKAFAIGEYWRVQEVHNEDYKTRRTNAEADAHQSLFEWSLMSFDDREVYLEHDFTDKAQLTTDALAEMDRRSAFDAAQTGAAPGASPHIDRLARAISRALLHAVLNGRGQRLEFEVVVCGAKPGITAGSANALTAAVRPAASAPAQGALPHQYRGPVGTGLVGWWHVLIQAVFGAPGKVAGPDDNLADVLAQAGREIARRQLNVRLNVVAIRFPAGGEQERLLRALCTAGGGQYEPAATAADLGDALKRLVASRPTAGAPLTPGWREHPLPPPQGVVEVFGPTATAEWDLGLELDVLDGHLTVMAVTPGSLADRATFERGDRLLTLNGVDTSRLTMGNVRELLRLQVGGRIAIKLLRPATGLSMNLVLTRQ